MFLIALAAAAAPVEIKSKDDLLDYEYSWSAEAAAVPALDRRFRADAARQKRDALATAREDRKARLGTGGLAGEWNGHWFSRSWETAGQSARLLSLEGGTGTYTGGAHPNSGSTSLLWDRRQGKEIRLDALLQRKGWWDGAIRQPFCILLDRERAEKRGEPVKRGDWPDQCPQLQELTLALEDEDSDGRFDHVRVTADNYVAGPYAEGGYIFSLPLTATMLMRLKPEYRSSFEPQPPVQ